MAWMETERAALVATLRQADPEAPTLDEGWNVRYLLAHLVQREHTPWLRAADDLQKSKPGQEKHLSRLAATAATPHGYEELVQKFAAGLPAWAPMAWIGDAGQLLEYVVHHEDVRRAGPVPAPARTLPPGQEEAVWKRLKIVAQLVFRRSPVGVELALPDGTAGTPASRRVVVHKGPDAVVLVGRPVELALYVMGRREVADVQIAGSAEAAQRFRTWSSSS